ncbi:MAG: pyridoxamine 5'-phosphate oxidase family protein [Ferruginibacter sp.]
MCKKLTEIQIDNILLSQSIGHLGCSNNNKPYVLPVTYLFLDDYIYIQTEPGRKLDFMRINPSVCFEVFRNTDMFNWESAIVWGTFEELNDQESIEARAALFDHVFQLMTPTKVHAHEHAVTAAADNHSRYKPIIFRIKITEKTGRSRKSQCTCANKCK